MAHRNEQTSVRTIGSRYFRPHRVVVGSRCFIGTPCPCLARVNVVDKKKHFNVGRERTKRDVSNARSPPRPVSVESSPTAGFGGELDYETKCYEHGRLECHDRSLVSESLWLLSYVGHSHKAITYKSSL